MPDKIAVPASSWRRRVTERLRTGEPVMAGSLYAEVSKDIPIHYAWRRLARYKDRKGQDKRECPNSATRGRWLLFIGHVISEFSAANVVRNPDGPIRANTVISVSDPDNTFAARYRDRNRAVTKRPRKPPPISWEEIL